MWSDKLTDLTTDCPGNALEAITLGRRYNVPLILKRAFYELLRKEMICQLNLAGLLDSANASKYLITSGDKRCLIRARERMNVAWSDVLDDAFHNVQCPTPTCLSAKNTGDWQQR